MAIGSMYVVLCEPYVQCTPFYSSHMILQFTHGHSH